MSDVNVTEKVARAIDPAIYPHINHLTGDAWAASKRATEAALAALSDPEVLAGMAEVLRKHSESKGDQGFLPSCRCGWVGSSRMAWVADLARHQTAALVDWLRGQG